MQLIGRGTRQMRTSAVSEFFELVKKNLELLIFKIIYTINMNILYLLLRQVMSNCSFKILHSPNTTFY